MNYDTERNGIEGWENNDSKTSGCSQDQHQEGSCSTQEETGGDKRLRVPAVESVGKRYGRLMVLGVLNIGRGKMAADAVCDCGQRRLFTLAKLRRGSTKSCGCLRIEEAGKMARTHGLSGTVEYNVWCAMRNRCESPGDTQYKDYGGRGIVACERWKHFENFISDMGKRPTSRHTLERLDNDKGYSPDNCIWETRKNQCRNKRDNLHLSVDGVEFVAADFIEKHSISGVALYMRVHRSRKKGVDHFNLQGRHIVILSKNPDDKGTTKEASTIN